MPMNYAVRACNNPPTWSVSSVLCALLFSWYICNAYRFLFRTRIANQIAGRVLKIYFRWNGIGYVEGSRSRRVFSWSALHENNSRQIENTNYDDTAITWLAVPYCVKERAHTHTNKYMHSICAILDFCTHNTQCKWDCDCDCNCESGNLSQTLETQTPII